VQEAERNPRQASGATSLMKLGLIVVGSLGGFGFIFSAIVQNTYDHFYGGLGVDLNEIGWQTVPAVYQALLWVITTLIFAIVMAWLLRSAFRATRVLGRGGVRLHSRITDLLERLVRALIDGVANLILALDSDPLPKDLEFRVLLLLLCGIVAWVFVIRVVAPWLSVAAALAIIILLGIRSAEGDREVAQSTVVSDTSESPEATDDVIRYWDGFSRAATAALILTVCGIALIVFAAIAVPDLTW